MFPGR
ncbi:hypothetical protein ACS0PU_012735 [Formica fusca]